MDDRERNRQGLTNFFDALQSVLVSIQNLNEVETNRAVELEQVRDRLQDARATLLLCVGKSLDISAAVDVCVFCSGGATEIFSTGTLRKLDIVSKADTRIFRRSSLAFSAILDCYS